MVFSCIFLKSRCQPGSSLCRFLGARARQKRVAAAGDGLAQILGRLGTDFQRHLLRRFETFLRLEATPRALWSAVRRYIWLFARCRRLYRGLCRSLPSMSSSSEWSGDSRTGPGLFGLDMMFHFIVI